MLFLTFLFYTLCAVAAALAVVALALWAYTSWTHTYWRRRGIKFDEPRPIVGSLGRIMRQSYADHLLEVYQRFPDEEYVGTYLAHKPLLMVHTPDLAKRILVSDSEQFLNRYLSAPDSDKMGQLNMFVGKAEVVSRIRRECGPMFTSARLRLLTGLMNLNARALVKKIYQDLPNQDKTPINLKEVFIKYTADTVGYTVFGLRMSALSGEPNPMWHMAHSITHWSFRRGLEFNIFWLVPVLAKFLRLKFFSESAVKRGQQLFWDVVEERKKANFSTDKDLVSLLLKIRDNIELPADADESLRDDLLMAQSIVFVLGTSDTTSTTLSCMLHELAHAPEKQERLYREITEAYEKSENDDLDFDQLNQIKYLTACIQETMRKYPPAPYLDRVNKDRYAVDERLTLEPGTPVFINLMALHYNPAFYPEPHAWRPERFPGDNEGDNRSFTWLPLGEGPRNCIGKRYGTAQIRAAMVAIMREFRVEPAAERKLEFNPYSVLISPKGGGRVTFVPRNKTN